MNAKKHYISILTADIIHSLFYDRFSTVHYNIFLGDNGSGKNSALLVFRILGYRVFYVTAASASNYYTFLSDIEEGQGCIAEDEAEDVFFDRDKNKIFSTGYTSGGCVPKVELLGNGRGREQGNWHTYCPKWIAMEELPEIKSSKRITERSFQHHFVVGDVEYNIKDIIKNGQDPEYKPLYDELIDLRKITVCFQNCSL